jgi:hypothetical protein
MELLALRTEEVVSPLAIVAMLDAYEIQPQERRARYFRMLSRLSVELRKVEMAKEDE